MAPLADEGAERLALHRSQDVALFQQIEDQVVLTSLEYAKLQT